MSALPSLVARDGVTPVAVPVAVLAEAAPEHQRNANSATATLERAVAISVNARGWALAVLAILASLLALQWAQKFVIPLLLGILIAYALNPPVAWLERIKVPRLVGILLVMSSVVGALAFGTYALRGQIQSIIEQLPEAAGKFSIALAGMRDGQLNAMQKVQAAASTIEKATTQATGAMARKQAATHVVLDEPSFKLSAFLWAGSMGAATFMGQAAMVLFLVFFLLLAGDTFKRKLVRLTGPSLSNKKITVQILDDIDDSIQKYMFMLLSTNALVAFLCWIAFHWIGLENAGGWALAAGLLHLIPYLGPSVTAVAVGMAAFIQFDAISAVLLAAGASLSIATFVGMFVTTWMTGKIARMNTAAVFISLLFWSWLWGVWGLLLSIPIIVIVKVVSERVEQMQLVAELLGE
ncbi:MAG TPA: AI-2E family transporter [Casimicrobiaceae bacterium]